MTTSFEMKIVLVDSSRDFGLGRGVVAKQIIDYNEEDLTSEVWLMVSLEREKEEFVGRTFKVYVTPCDELDLPIPTDRLTQFKKAKIVDLASVYCSVCHAWLSRENPGLPLAGGLICRLCVGDAAAVLDSHVAELESDKKMRGI